jgi:hypothetical protein
VETTPAIEPNPLYVAGARTVVIEEPRTDRGQPDEGRQSEEGRGGPGREGQGRSRGSDDQGQGGRSQGQDRADQQNGRQGRREGQGQSQDKGQPQNKGQDRNDRQDQPQPQQQPSTMKILLISAGTALLCGVIGAMGYSYFFGSESDKSSGQSRGQSGSSSKGGSGSKSDFGSKGDSGSKGDFGSKGGSDSKGGGGAGSNPKSGASSNEQGSSSNSVSNEQESSSDSKSSSIPGSSPARNVDTLEQQIVDLMRRIDRLYERIDHMSRASNDSHAVQLAVQHELGELTRKVNDLAPLAERFRLHEQEFDKFRDEFKVVRAQVNAMQGGRTDPGAVHRPGTSRSSPPPPEASINPAMKEGIELIERGQYAAARLIFVRLQVAQPDDARVWYFSALAEALTYGSWDGEPKRLADKGFECERAGHPSTAEIDAALATSVPIKGAEWIASLRHRVLDAR